MQMELFSRSKRREQDKSGDDIAIVVPGLVWAVLDGATDPLGGVYDGESSGRLAARTAGQALVQLLQAEGPEVSAAPNATPLSGGSLSEPGTSRRCCIHRTRKSPASALSATTCVTISRKVLRLASGVFAAPSMHIRRADLSNWASLKDPFSLVSTNQASIGLK